MNRQELSKEFIELALNDTEGSRKDLIDLEDQVSKSSAIYKGKPIPFLYMPKFFTLEDVEAFEGISSMMMDICQRMISLYKERQEIRDLYGFEKRLERLILKESKYRSSVPMARLDIFYNDPKSFMFCEINTDGTSAMNEDRELSNILSLGKTMEKFARDYEISSFDLFDSWVEEVKNIYSESGGSESRPRVAIIDILSKGSPTEFEAFRDSFIKGGFDCVIADARDLSYKDGLYYREDKVDIVYRRLVTKDMMDNIDDLGAFEKACLDEDTLIIGNIHSQVVHTKLFFSLLHKEEVKKYFSDKEIAFIENHIPYTQMIQDAGERFDEWVENKDKYLIKPLDYYASIGVYAGKGMTKDEWEAVLRDHMTKPYILQRYYDPPIEQNLDLSQGELKLIECNHINGLFVYNRSLKGVYSRAGRKAIISGLHDVYTLPSLLVQRL